jgi:uncharacterized protein YigE (DUF2233 family)
MPTIKIRKRSLIIIIVLFIGILFRGPIHAQVYEPGKIKMFWKDKSGRPYYTFAALRKDHPELQFIMNAGMYDKLQSAPPLGLFIENKKQLRPLRIVVNKGSNYGTPPSGVFYIAGSRAYVVVAHKGDRFPNAHFATQSGPMLLIEGKINKNLPKGNLIMRNGVGIRNDGKVVFGCFRSNFIDFAAWFKDQGCRNALFLDGGISDYWKPSSPISINSTLLNIQYGPMIGVVK